MVFHVLLQHDPSLKAIFLQQINWIRRKRHFFLGVDLRPDLETNPYLGRRRSFSWRGRIASHIPTDHIRFSILTTGRIFCCTAERKTYFLNLAKKCMRVQVRICRCLGKSQQHQDCECLGKAKADVAALAKMKTQVSAKVYTGRLSPSNVKSTRT